MNRMTDKPRYQPHPRAKDNKRSCPYSLSRYVRVNNGNPSDVSHHQSKSLTYSNMPSRTSVMPSMTKETVSPSISSTAIPQERQGWIRSVTKMKTDGGTEQKTQYLETMLRMQSWIRSVEKTNTNESTEHRTQYSETILRVPQQQKSSIDSTTFDRIRFADQQIPTNTTENTNNNRNSPDGNSVHLISDVNDPNEISIIEVTSLDSEPCSNQISNGQPIPFTDSDPSRWSGFLIDNCGEEQPSAISAPPCSTSPLPTSSSSTTQEFTQKNHRDLNKRRAMLVYEFESADVGQRQVSKCQKQFCKKLKKKKKFFKTKTTEQPALNRNLLPTVNNKNHQELPSDWVIECDTTETDQLSQLTDMIEKTSKAMTDEDKVANINIILEKMKKQQMELRKLKQHVMSMLHKAPTSDSTNTRHQNSSTDQDLLMKFLNQPVTSGCWLCSGKTYTEVATQCNDLNE